MQMGLLFLGPINSWATWLSIFNLDISGLLSSLQGSKSSCIAPLSPYGVMMLNLASPVSMTVMLFIIMIYTKLWYKHKWQAWNHIRTLMSVLLFIYVPVTGVILAYLNCIPVGTSVSRKM